MLSDEQVMKYDGFAWLMAHTYFVGDSSKDDIYQVAMEGLTRLLNKDPDAHQNVCMTAMRRYVIGYLRAEKPRNRLNNIMSIEEIPRAELRSPVNVEGVVVERVYMEQLYEEISRLRPEEQAVLAVANERGAVTELARTTGINIKTAESRLLRARVRLRTWRDAG